MSAYGSLEQPILDYWRSECPSCGAEHALVRFLMDDFAAAFDPANDDIAFVNCTICGRIFRAWKAQPKEEDAA